MSYPVLYSGRQNDNGNLTGGRSLVVREVGYLDVPNDQRRARSSASADVAVTAMVFFPTCTFADGCACKFSHHWGLFGAVLATWGIRSQYYMVFTNGCPT